MLIGPLTPSVAVSASVASPGRVSHLVSFAHTHTHLANLASDEQVPQPQINDYKPHYAEQKHGRMV